MRYALLIVCTCLIALSGCSSSAKLKVATAGDAQRVVIEFLELEVLAQHSFAVSGLLALGEEVNGFGGVGARFWEVRRTNSNAGDSIDGLFWVNAETGVVLQLHPKQLGSDKPLTKRSTGPREARPVNLAL